MFTSIRTPSSPVKTCAELVQKAGTTPRDARHAEANEVSFLLRDRL